MLIYSHRGESTYAPENTMSSFYMAYFNNSDGIETDIRKTKDNKLVLIHDKTINRTSNSKTGGKVSDYTYKELLKLDFGKFKHAKYKGEKIVLLEDFLKYFSNKNILLNLEIKESGYEKQILDLVNKYNTKNITLMSFKYNILKKLRELDKKIKLGWLLYEIDNYTIQKLKEINAHQAMCTAICIDENDIYECHNNNFVVTAWGILLESDIKRLESIGVDRIIYNSYVDAKEVLDNDID